MDNSHQKMIDLVLISTLGFLGSFGHCVGMCGPLTVAFSLSNTNDSKKPSWQFHLLLNIGRILSYALVGAAIGGLGSVLVASGQMAGLGSVIRRGMAILTGLMLIALGLAQIRPDLIPRLPIWHPLSPEVMHNRLSGAMVKLSMKNNLLTPLFLGLVWGLIPCGFLYTAQIKAAETGSLKMGMVTMLAFGLGTFPTLLGVGLLTSKLSANRRSQLYRLGGWITLTIGILTLLRTGNHVDYTGHGSLICLMLALIARPISRFFPQLLQYRRFFGVAAFVLALVHMGQMIDHTLNWKIDAFWFMIPQHQWGIGLGTIALILITPAALTSFDKIQSYLGKSWRKIHLLAVPAFILVVVHIVLSGSSYFGGFEWTVANQIRVGMLVTISLFVLLIRKRSIWCLFSLDQFYVSPSKSK
ncbi:urease accessory protein UreH domain-containing protein [Limnoraphis robusta]|uniref:urease accessory protein UreH domain-containing protein n=1 Tax=Limnoraphis robusta TaxID=1118279 RepID=UPI002B1FEA29|nr:sulfite exporter TauE/SafE family protein [Limnoraphis robusta]MEA5500668.1 sulfite exporter TauE/SafE family protein [Limnoraphis robusta BA-68 BA1]